MWVVMETLRIEKTRTYLYMSYVLKLSLGELLKTSLDDFYFRDLINFEFQGIRNWLNS